MDDGIWPAMTLLGGTKRPYLWRLCGARPWRLLKCYGDNGGGLAGFGPCCFAVSIAGQGDGHATLAADAWLAKKSQGCVGLGKGLVELGKADFVGLAFYEESAGGRGAVEVDVGHGEAEDGASVQGKLAEVLGDKRDETGIVRTG